MKRNITIFISVCLLFMSFSFALADNKIANLNDAILNSRLISAGAGHTVCLSTDGIPKATGVNTYGQCDIADWRDIVAISAGDGFTVGLNYNGKVIAIGKNDFGQCNTEKWENVISIDTGYAHTVGLKSDKSVIAIGKNKNGECDTYSFEDIAMVSAGDNHTIGLKSDGTVVAVGNNDFGQCNVTDWRDVVSISAGSGHTVGLKRDGTVIAVGNNDEKQCDIGNWKNIAAISSSGNSTIGLTTDGNVVSAGNSSYWQNSLSGFNNIIAISAGNGHIIALKSNGYPVTAGNNTFGQCDVGQFGEIGIIKEDETVNLIEKFNNKILKNQENFALSTHTKIILIAVIILALDLIGIILYISRRKRKIYLEFCKSYYENNTFNIIFNTNLADGTLGILNIDEGKLVKYSEVKKKELVFQINGYDKLDFGKYKFKAEVDFDNSQPKKIRRLYKNGRRIYGRNIYSDGYSKSINIEGEFQYPDEQRGIIKKLKPITEPTEPEIKKEIIENQAEEKTPFIITDETAKKLLTQLNEKYKIRYNENKEQDTKIN